jgi:hypothetical protein
MFFYSILACGMQSKKEPVKFILYRPLIHVTNYPSLDFDFDPPLLGPFCLGKGLRRTEGRNRRGCHFPMMGLTYKYR